MHFLKKPNCNDKMPSVSRAKAEVNSHAIGMPLPNSPDY
jgi:hypothetical protein